MRAAIPIVLTTVAALAGCALGGCGGDPPPKAPPAPTAPAALTCPVCGTPFPSSRGVPAGEGSGAIAVCSQGCAIRHDVEKNPPPPAVRGAAESRDDEDE
jgi:hypothetical protein